MSRYKGKPCYYCGNPAVGKEHVPAKQLFAAFECDSITVPGCATHNTDKTLIDQAFVSALLIPLNNGKGRYNLSDYVLKALSKAQPALEHTKKKVFSAAIIDTSNNPALKSLPLVSYTSLYLFDWMRQVTAGLIYDVIGEYDTSIDWNTSGSWSPSFIDSPTSRTYKAADLYEEFQLRSQFEQEILRGLKWFEGWSAKPRPYPKGIFRFQVHFEHREVLFRYRFYDQYSWYVAFQPSLQTLRKLWQKTLTHNLNL